MNAAAILAGQTQPLGAPAVFLVDVLTAHRPADQCSAPWVSHAGELVREYDSAKGYVFAWGQLMEQSLGRYMVWRVIPVALWTDYFSSAVDPVADIPAMTAALHVLARRHVPREPLEGVYCTGCNGGGQRAPHALLSLLCTRPENMDGVRRWLATDFLGQVLPPLLVACQSALANLPTTAGRPPTPAHDEGWPFTATGPRSDEAVDVHES